MSKSNELIVISGPTASGKTAMALDMASHLGLSIFSADSRQIYKEMSIGVAKPSIKELNQVPHYFINHISIHQHYDAGMFEEEVIAQLSHHFTNHDKAILVGGTGLYIQAVLHGLDQFPQVPLEIVTELNETLENGGLEVLQDELKKKDYITYSKIDLQNSRRVIRALSIIRSSGQPFSQFTTGIKKERSFAIDYKYLDINRDTLYQRIDERVDHMIQHGLLNEVETLFPFKGLKALDTVGYAELFQYLKGECTIDQAIEKIKQHSRNYAKRQITWFKKFNP